MMYESNSGRVQSVFYRAEAGYTIGTGFFPYNSLINNWISLIIIIYVL